MKIYINKFEYRGRVKINKEKIKNERYGIDLNRNIEEILENITLLKKKGIYLELFETEIGQQKKGILLAKHISDFIIQGRKKIIKSIWLLNSPMTNSILNLLIKAFNFFCSFNKFFIERFDSEFFYVINEVSEKFCYFYNRFNKKIGLNDFFNDKNQNSKINNLSVLGFLLNTLGLDYDEIGNYIFLNRDSVQIFDFYGAFIRDKVEFLPYALFFSQELKSPYYLFIRIIEALIFSYGLLVYYILLEDLKIRKEILNIFIQPSCEKNEDYALLCDIIKNLFLIFIKLNLDSKIIDDNFVIINSVDFSQIIKKIFLKFNAKLYIIEKKEIDRVNHQIFRVFTEIRAKPFNKKFIKPNQNKAQIVTKSRKKSTIQINLFGNRV